MPKTAGTIRTKATSVGLQTEAKASKSAKTFIEWRSRQTSAAAPRLLFHYTSTEGLIKIVESGEIWATSIRHLSDASEYLYTLDLVVEAGGPLTDYVAFGYVFSYEREVAKECGAAPLCTASLTEKEDLLSQWRAYCPPGGGYSIGILESGPRGARQADGQ